MSPHPSDVSHRRAVAAIAVGATLILAAGAVLGFSYFRTAAEARSDASPVASLTRSDIPASTSAAPTTTGPVATTTPPVTVATKVAPPPPPRTSSGAKPSASNTGVPAGTALTVVTGDKTYSQDNQVISGLDIRGNVRITGNNVTLKNSIIRGVGKGGTSGCQNAAVLRLNDGVKVTIQDVEVVATSPNACLDGVWAANATLTRLHVHNVVDGVKADDSVLLQDSYIHDLARFASDPNQGGGPTHNDGVQSFYGNQHITIRHNTIAVTDNDNATFQLSQDGGRRAADIHIENNWLDGGGCTLNLSHSGGPTPMTDIYVIGNRFGRHSYYDCPILVSTQTILSANSGNVWDDTGKPIPAPDRHD
jgi:hypothetical protein